MYCIHDNKHPTYDIISFFRAEKKESVRVGSGMRVIPWRVFP